MSHVTRHTSCVRHTSRVSQVHWVRLNDEYSQLLNVRLS